MALCAAGWLALWGCASGYAPELSEQELLPEEPGSQSGGMSPGSAGSGPAPAVDYMGEPCQMGQSEACMCDEGGTGTRVCRFDLRSPTQGSFGECQSCTADEGAAGTGPETGSGGSGAGSGGTGGSSGGTGGSSGGTGGTASTPPPPPSSGSRPGWCLFVPVPIPGVCS